MPYPMKMIKNIGIVLLVLAGFHSFAETYMVRTQTEFDQVQKQAVSGDSIVWGKGSYSNVNLSLETDGVFFVAETSGVVTFTGSSVLAVSGNGNTLIGFQFVKGKIKGDVVDISGNNNTIQQVNIEAYDSHYYLRIRPNCQYNSILYCNFEAKPETKESSVVQVEATEGQPGYHLISHCSFKNHTAPPDAGGDFGIEALRIGYSYQRTFISRTIVEYCYFEKCNGDYEIISCKACENIMRYNTFRNNGPAHLTLRHGSRNMVYGNFFLAGAGLRIKEGQNHAVINNYFDTGKHMAIQIQNHHFDPVDTVNISNNTFISCSPLQLGGEGEYPPRNVSLANNIFSSSVNPVSIDPSNTESWQSNYIKNGNNINSGKVKVAEYRFVQNKTGLYEIEAAKEAFADFVSSELFIFEIPELDDDSSVGFDIMKQVRGNNSNDLPGSYLPSEKYGLKFYATADNTGPEYLQ